MIGENVNLFNFGLRAASKGAFLKRGRQKNKKKQYENRKKTQRNGKGKRCNNKISNQEGISLTSDLKKKKKNALQRAEARTS